MKCVVIVLLSIINCQSVKDKFRLTNVINNNYGDPGATPIFYPLQMAFLESSSSNRVPVDEDHEAEGEAYHRPQHTQPHQTIPTTSLSRIVDTKYGKLQGLTVTLVPPGTSSKNNNNNLHMLKNKNVDVFLSVPYASPPIKSHRFSPTQTPIPWDGIRSVIKPGFVCPQVMPEFRDETAALKDMPKAYLDYLRRVEPYLRNQSEDCLYLNIFSPSSPQQQQTPFAAAGGASQDSKLRLKPVLVFIHGGKFSWGSGNLYDGTLLAAYADILFVTLNYRLGVLGFLNVNTSPNTKPRVANYGLMDQIAALHWIKENIVFFGGDPENITMMGYEAGAACIHFLMSSPAVVPGLFHRAILIAGSSKAPWALVDDPSSVANALAESLNCSVTPTSNANVSFSNLNVGIFPQPLGRERDSASFGRGSSSPSDPLLDCLKNKHFSYFAKFIPPKFSVDFGPSVDGVVIHPNFWQTTSESQIGKRDVSRKYDLLFGISSLEMLPGFSERDLLVGFESTRRDAILRTLIRNSYRFHLNEILATITNEYVDWERGIQHPIAARDLTLNAVTDCLSLAPVIAASESAEIRRSFFYVFEHSTKDGFNTFQKSGGAGGEEQNYFFGVPLVDKILPFFPTLLPSNYSKSEMALSEQLINYLSNFVYSGDPNEPSQGELIWPISKEKNKFKNLIWDPYDRLHQKYLELTANKIRIRSHYRAHQMAIWLRLVPELQRTGAQYASAMHNKMTGGYDPSLYVGSFKLPEELDAANHYADNLDLSDLYFNGSGVHPSPPTTCFSPMLSISSAELGRGNGNVGASVKRSFEEQQRRNETGIGHSFIAAYTTNLPLTIAVGASLLVLNIFIFALLYYHHEKRREREGTLAGGVDGGTVESQQLNSYGEPPELLQSNSTTATSFHQSASIYSYDDEGHDYYHQQHGTCTTGSGGGENVNFATFQNHERRAGGGGGIMKETGDSNSSCAQNFNGTCLPSQEVHFSSLNLPRPISTTCTAPTNNQIIEEHPSNYCQSTDQLQQQQQQQTSAGFGITLEHSAMQSVHFQDNTLPLIHHHRSSTSNTNEYHRRLQDDCSQIATPATAAATTIGVNCTLPRKPIPPTRSITNYTATQRQLFSVIMSLLTFGIL